MDLTEAVALSVPCTQCGGRYDVSLQQLVVAHEATATIACPGGAASDGPPLVIAELLERAFAEDLLRAWAAAQRRAQAVGGTITILGTPVT
jgi:hypothetical protein